MMDNNLDKYVKDRWLKLYQNDINTYQEKRDIDRYNKMREEQETVSKIKNDIEEDRKRRFMRKQEIINKAQNEIKDHFMQKRLYEEKLEQDKIKEIKYKGTFDIHHEERLNKLKNYMNLLSEKVDINMNKYIIYNNNMSDKISSRSHSKNNSQLSSPIKDEIMIMNNLSTNNPNYNQFLNNGNGLDFKSNELYQSYELNKQHEDRLNKLISQYAPQRYGVVKDYGNNNIIHYNENDIGDKAIDNIKSLIYPPYKSKNYTNNNNYLINNESVTNRSKLLSKSEVKRIDHKEKWKHDKYNISDDISKGINKDYINIVNENSKTKKENILNYKLHNSEDFWKINNQNETSNKEENRASFPINSSYDSSKIYHKRQTTDPLNLNIQNYINDTYANNLNSEKKYSLGDSSLNQNILTNPHMDYNYNKYLSKNYNYENKLIKNGSNIIT